jgi:mannose-6-phosphate isomerase-like protein (cupin superfamily)
MRSSAGVNREALNSMPATAARSYETKTLGAAVDAIAPDGTAVRLLLSLAGGSMAHFELPAGAVSHAVTHRTVEEIWFVLSGRGAIWRRKDGQERIDPLAPGTSLTIPLGTAFQFRAEAGAPLAFIAITMPPWPGAGEALATSGPWAPTIAAGST